MKVSTQDALALLRLFEQATEDDVPRQIERISSKHPSKINQLVSFRFKNRDYFLLLDETAHDRSDYIMSQLVGIVQHAELIENPKSPMKSYGMPYKGKDVYLLIEHSQTVRLDSWLAENMPEFSRSSWQKHIKSGHVFVDNTAIESPKYQVNPQQQNIDVRLPLKDHGSKDMLPVIYIDDDVVVVDKPAGMLTHHKNATDTEITVADISLLYGKDLDPVRGGVVHRLDRDTSGVMILGRNPQAVDYLKQQFADRTVQKSYQAIIDGYPRHSQLKIDLPIDRSTKKRGTFLVSASGKSAETTMRLLAQSLHYCLVELQPKTGRTHQLRVHMAHLKTPIHGDRLYGGAKAERLYLHANKLAINLPGISSNKKQVFVSPVPSQFDNLLNNDHA
jgi:23S rRNA pseudouridine1911/1915/1917 synthase